MGKYFDPKDKTSPYWENSTLYTHNGILFLDGVRRSIDIKTEAYTLNELDGVIICNSTTAFTVTLPVASGSGQIYFIKNINTGAVTLDGNSGDIIDVATTQILGQWDAMQIVDYAANKWVIV